MNRKRLTKKQGETYCCRCKRNIAIDDYAYCGYCDEIEEEIYINLISKKHIWG